MASIRDIMDVVDVDPLESQAAQRSREPSHRTHPSEEPDSTTSASPRISKGKGPAAAERPSTTSTKSRRKSTRAQKSSSTKDMASDRSSTMDMHLYQNAAVVPHAGPSNSSRRAPQPDIPVKLTPVTKRVSRAKKGVKVHNCDQCQKVFTRAEHLRRHQLSHNTATFACTFQDCERVFYRQDLLQRHYNRHETQGEKPWKSREHSRSPSAGPDRRMKVETYATNESPGADAQFPGSYGTTASFESINEAFAPRPSIRDAARGSSNIPANDALGDSAAGLGLADHAFNAFLDPFHHTSIHLPTTVPDYTPNMYPADGSLCSSDSPYSTPSSVASRYGGATDVRGRSESIATNPEIISWSPVPPLPAQVSRGIDDVGEPFSSEYISPMLSPLNLGSMAALASPETGFESVGTPTPSPYPNSYSQQVLSVLSSKVHAEPLGLLDSGSSILLDAHRREFIGINLSFSELNRYMDSFWVGMYHILPAIHRPTFEPLSCPALTMTMAAWGTVCCSSPQDARCGKDLHRRARRMLKQIVTWDLQTMTAILLNEGFEMFRGTEINGRPSTMVREVYLRLITGTESNDSFSDLTAEKLEELKAANHSSVTKSSIWQQWVQHETHGRVVAGCFLFDLHQASCFEQPLVWPDLNVCSKNLKLPCSERIWNAGTEKDWEKLISNGSYSGEELSSYVRRTASQQTGHDSIFSAGLALGSLIRLLPDKVSHGATGLDNEPIIKAIEDQFSNFLHSHTWLLNYYTPVRDLLATTGDTWVLGRKTKSLSDFNAMVNRVRIWVSTPAAAKAVWHSCKIIEILAGSLRTANEGPTEIADHWYLFLATLVCWSFGQRFSTVSRSSITSTSSDEVTPSESTCRTKQSAERRIPSFEDFSRVKQAGMAYVECILEHPYEDLPNVAARCDASVLVDMIHMRLTSLPAMNTSGLLNDAARVLSRLGVAGRVF